MREFTRIRLGSKLLRNVNDEGPGTGTFNSLVFHTNSAVDSGFAGISDMVSEVSMR